MNYPMYGGFPQVPMNQPMMPSNQGFVQNQQQFVPNPQPSIIQERTSIPMQPNLIVTIDSMDQAKQYPTAPGNTVFMRTKDRRHFFVKSMGYSQFDEPSFESYTRDDEINVIDEPIKQNELPYITKDDLDCVFGDLNQKLDRIQNSFDDLKRKQNQPRPQTKEK